MLIGLINQFVLPDGLVFEPGTRPFWDEVKYKDHCDKYQTKRQWQHGIDLPNWLAYLDVERVTGIEGQLSIVQCKPGKEAHPHPVLMWNSFRELKKYVQIVDRPHTTFRRGAAYFPMDSLRCSPIEFELPKHLKSLATKVNPWEQKSKAGIAPAWPIVFCDESPFEQAVAAGRDVEAGQHRCHCGKSGFYGYRYKGEGELTWVCADHRLLWDPDVTIGAAA
jgi:hypothetical protein